MKALIKKEHAKEAIIWFLEHLNLTEVLNERTEDSPWTWLGSMFYAGQLYTTIGALTVKHGATLLF